MKKRIITILSVLILLLSAMGLVGCDFSFDGKDGKIVTETTKLSTPSILRVEDDIVYWSHVDGSRGYVIEIGDSHQKEVSGNYCPISSLYSSSFSNLYARVKALPSSSLLNSESDWSQWYGPINYDKSGSSSNKLSSPKNIYYSIEDKKIVWDTVENGLYYNISIIADGDERIYISYKNEYDISFPKDTQFSFKIQAVAESGTKYENSSWSELLQGNYIKDSHLTKFSEEYYDKGLGRAVNLIEGKYNEIDLGSSSIFDEDLLYNTYVQKNNILKGESQFFQENSIDEYIDEYNRTISAKLNISKIKPGLKKIVSQKSFEMDVSYENTYTKRSSDQTSYYFYTFENMYQATEYSFYGYNSIDETFKAILSDEFIAYAQNAQQNISDSTLANFIKKWGTHIITDAIHGANLSLNYSLIGNKNEIDSCVKNDATTKLGVSKSYWEVNVSSGLNISDRDFASTENVNSTLKISFNGGNNTGMVLSQDGMDSFISSYASWAESTNDSNKHVLIDVGDGSLYCVWDILGDEFQALKDALDEFFNTECEKAYVSFSNKVNSIISENADFDNYSGGTGSQNDPYVISKASDLLNISLNMDACYRLNKNIDISDGEEWNPIGDKSHPFNGVIDGDGFSIIGLYRTERLEYVDGYTYFGFIGCLGNKGTIKNLTLSEININRSNDENRESKSRNTFISGICGYSYGSIINCKVTGKINYNIYHSGTCNLSGICGYLNGGEVLNCTSSLELRGTSYSGLFGGIVAYAEGGKIYDCINKGDIYNSCGTMIGGFNITSGVCACSSKSVPVDVQRFSCDERAELKLTYSGVRISGTYYTTPARDTVCHSSNLF